MNKTNWALVSLIIALMMLSFLYGVATERDRNYSLARQNINVLAKYYCDNQDTLNTTWTEWFLQNQNKTLNQIENEHNP